MGLQTEIKNAVRWGIPVVDSDTNLREVVEVMATHDSAALIVKTGDDFAGIITDLDVFDSITSEDELDKNKVANFLSACELLPARTIRNPCVQLDENQTVENAIRLLSASGTHNLVVTGKDKNSYGMLSSRDLLKLLLT